MSTSNELIEANFKLIQGDLEDMKQSMSKIADALTKIAVLEEKHQTLTSSMTRIVERLDTLDKRQSDTELKQAVQENTVHVTLRAIQVAWVVLGSALMTGAWHLLKVVVLAQQ